MPPAALFPGNRLSMRLSRILPLEFFERLCRGALHLPAHKIPSRHPFHTRLRDSRRSSPTPRPPSGHGNTPSSCPSSNRRPAFRPTTRSRHPAPRSGRYARCLSLSCSRGSRTTKPMPFDLPAAVKHRPVVLTVPATEIRERRCRSTLHLPALVIHRPVVLSSNPPCRSSRPGATPEPPGSRAPQAMWTPAKRQTTKTGIKSALS